MTDIGNPEAMEHTLIPEKIRMWERKLLDLSLRNTLINLKPGRNCLPVVARSGKALEALLMEEREALLRAWTPEEIPELDVDEAESDVEAGNDFEQLRRLKDVTTSEEGLSLFARERVMQTVLKRLYRSARTAMDESGAGTLFMGVGMLRWFDNKGNDHLAPLVLMPVTLCYRRLRWFLTLREGEVDVNVTMLEKLRQEYDIEIPGIEPLPREKDGGIDIEAVYSAFREAVSAQGNWTVEDMSVLANFSYGAFVMWNDLRRREQRLMDNGITRSLITGIRMKRQEPLAAEGRPFLPLDTDETQLHAVLAARRGESFVLLGPPGTGKSQTITTLIANLLADGRRVLFVAEKQAALEVVKNRLEGIGIGAYCLALHSTGASTRNALNQLQRLIDLPEPEKAEAYQDSLAHVDQRAEALDALFHAMHDPMRCGFDLYTALQRHEALREAFDLEDPDEVWLDDLTPAALEDVRRMILRLAASGRAVGHPARFPLRDLDAVVFEPDRRQTLEERLRAYRVALEDYGRAMAVLAEKMGERRPATRAEYARLSITASDALFWETEGRHHLRRLTDANWIGLLDMVNHFVAAQQLRAQLSKSFKPEFFEQDGAVLYAEWKALSGNPVLNRLRSAGLVRRLNTWAQKPVSAETLWVPLRALANLQSEEIAANRALEQYCPLLGEAWQGDNTDWIALQKQYSAAQAHARQFGSYAWLTSLRERLISDSGTLALAKEADVCRSRLNALDVGLDKPGDKEDPEADWLEALKARCDASLEALGKAGDWLAWLNCADEARAMGLENVVRAYKRGMDHDALWPAFEKTLCGALARRRIQSDPRLAQFTGRMTDALSEEYRALDSEMSAWSRRALACRLYEHLTEQLETADKTPDLSRLRRVCASKRMGTSLRQLFEQIPELMSQLCSCMLMNPVSVAQFLPDDLPDFDVVIFDEASQLLTSRAVGALSRARSAIIVGDPNQMPPTTFFTAQFSEGDDPELEDLESVLDDCLAVGVQSRSLQWHYRSCHESLIALSNRLFYDGRLMTFPSADARTSHVHTIWVDGVFERSGRRVNRSEAQAVLAELIRRAKDPECAGKSVGVITFNLAQQNLIDDLVSAAAAKDPDLAAWLEHAVEPMFIKNLENVQGDERDVILFSVGYGPDADGAVHMNFGPLNRDGGWRRLNVAITRAREEMLLFTSMSPADIRINATTARGVSALQAFLAYAANGGEAGKQDQANTARDGIAEAFCDELTRRGWQVERNIGNADFRVSIAVVDPDNPGRYRLGILLDDGAAPISARDREITRLALLERLGWSLTRLYALDWCRNRQGELRRILELLGESADQTNNG